MKKGTILITGASSGIGKAFALELAKQGFPLLITGRKEDKLVALSEELRSTCHVPVAYLIADLSDEGQLACLLSEIEARNDMTGLINNAGFGCGCEFSGHTIEGHLQMLKVHIMAAVRLTYAILPQMIRRKDGFIINVSSLGAFIPAPGNTVYAASKLFLNSFSESLSMEVRKYGLKVQCLCPGLTRSEFHRRRLAGGKIPGDHSILWMEPDRVVKKSLKFLSNSCVLCIPGFINRTMALVCSLIPRRIYYFIMSRSAKTGISKDPPSDIREMQPFQNNELLIIRNLIK